MSTTTRLSTAWPTAPLNGISNVRKDETSGKANVKVYQLHYDSPAYRHLSFMDYDFVKDSEELRLSNYKEVYSTDIDGYLPEQCCAYLEALYAELNIGRHPEGYNGHSLSMSDVVAIDHDGEAKYFYVDSIGFKELPSTFTEC